MAALLPLLALPLAVSAAAAATTTSSGYSLKPTAGSTWNIELIQVPPTSAANDPKYNIWDYDLFDSPNSTIQAFHAKGHPVICYFSAGSYEEWRPDAKQFPSAALGKPLDGWAGERWLDTRNTQVRQIMTNRIQLAKAKGCDGVDPDNIDGYGNPTGFNLTKADGINYVQFLANTAHTNGLAYGLKNGGDIIPSVVNVSDWVINEQCVQYSECALYQPFIKANKPVFHLEYTESDPASAAFIKKSCGNADAKGFSTLIKHLNLSDWTTTCPNVGSSSSDNTTTSASASPTVTASSESAARLASSTLATLSILSVMGGFLGLI